MQLGAAGAMSLGAPRLTQAAETAVHRSMMNVPFEKREPRVAVIGTGGRGTSLLGDLLAVDAQIAALCDVVPAKAEHAASLVVAAGQKKPALYTQGPHHYEELVARNDVDLILVATPWSWHAPMALAAMEHGKDVAIEVPGVRTLEECWQIVHASEQTRKHCMILENCCYGYNETLILRMIHAGLFGELLYGEGAYIHDLREELFSNAGEGLWRRTEHTLRNGNLYPTHGLGPVANYMGIQRGDRFASLVSMSSPQRGLDAYRKDHLAPGDPRWQERYICGDMNTTLIKTAKGLTITVKHAVSTPHPYDRINLIAGTKGLFQDYPPRIYFDGMNKDESFGIARRVQAVPAPAVGARGRHGAQERRPRRHGSDHDLPIARVRAPGSRAGSRCVRLRRVGCGRAVERGIRAPRQRAGRVSRFHRRRVEATADLGDCHPGVRSAKRKRVAKF